MRLLPGLLLVFLLVPTAQAQSGVGNVRGYVLPERADGWAGGSWQTGADSTTQAGDPVVTLTPLAILRQDVFSAPIGTDASDGSYDFEGVPMGLYRLRIAAQGFAVWEAEVYVLSDSETVVNVLLRRSVPAPE